MEGTLYEDSVFAHRWQRYGKVVGFMKFSSCIIDGMAELCYVNKI